MRMNSLVMSFRGQLKLVHLPTAIMGKGGNHTVNASSSCFSLFSVDRSRIQPFSSQNLIGMKFRSYGLKATVLQCLPQHRQLSRSSRSCNSNSSSSGPVKVKNPRPRGIVPFGEDYGGYDESKHEEYEDQATNRQTKIKLLKKVVSSAIFVSVLVTVMWARNKKRRMIEEYTKNVTFLPKDYLFTGSHNSFCIVSNDTGTETVVLPSSIVQDGTIHYVQTMELRPGDVVVASFPKTGTTICQEIVYLMQNNLDFKKAGAAVLEDRFPFLEYPYPGVKSVDKMKSPRLIKTHLPYAFLPKNAESAKIIYITRNPKDTAVSYFHFTRMLSFLGFTGSFKEFMDRFIKDELPYSPFFGHLESYLRHTDDSHVLIVNYEEFIKDPAAVIQKIATFLDKTFTSEEISKLVEHTSFQSMALNSSVNYEHWVDLGFHKKGEAPFMRKGKIGDWRNYFNNQTNEDFDKWILERNKSHIKFDYYP